MGNASTKEPVTVNELLKNLTYKHDKAAIFASLDGERLARVTSFQGSYGGIGGFINARSDNGAKEIDVAKAKGELASVEGNSRIVCPSGLVCRNFIMTSMEENGFVALLDFDFLDCDVENIYRRIQNHVSQMTGIGVIPLDE